MSSGILYSTGCYYKDQSILFQKIEKTLNFLLQRKAQQQTSVNQAWSTNHSHSEVCDSPNLLKQLKLALWRDSSPLPAWIHISLKWWMSATNVQGRAVFCQILQVLKRWGWKQQDIPKKPKQTATTFFPSHLTSETGTRNTSGNNLPNCLYQNLTCKVDWPSVGT